MSDLGRKDAVISFNYDLVVERALRGNAESRRIPFSKSIYRVDFVGSDAIPALPKVLKLHGSVNWKLDQTNDGYKLRVLTSTWTDFDAPGYRGYSGVGTWFPIFLPFWDKQVTKEPWLRLWQKAHQQLQKTKYIIVWGFSIPNTDIKARELFNISVADGGRDRRLCVINPSQATRDRWRELLPNAQYWEYDNVKAFSSAAPSWWWH